MTNDPFPMDASELADLIDIPLERWPGNCHGIALEILHMVPVEGMKLVRGHYLGYVHRDSVYGGGPQQHSWLELEDGRILDPTRWAIENPSKPSIYLGINDGYDAYGAQLNASIPPGFGSPGQHLIPIIKRLSSDQFAGIFPGAEKPKKDDDRSWENYASRLHFDIKKVPEHLESPAEFYGALEQAGLKYLIQIDKWIDVMLPETVTCKTDANRYFDLPPREELTDTAALQKVFDRFLCIEDRENIEEELEEIGFSLERDLWDPLNKMDRYYKNEPIETLPGSVTNTLSVIAGDLLGKGFGKELEVERFAKSIGYPRNDLKELLEKFGHRCGYDLSW
ncbi:hypothetical protein [Sulfitobacter sp. R18_1]|uniref:hypothetical protein n=1 Tax=Sulfitobacter sp. R18_1 TaxID=2821104 RepID=UPI001ADA8348|nr:hypothetical protein [Sulfitobacter sp. R18_1]MBO9428206.1 hypothetical protein [Sulfitobacter sp. R18_1]